MQHPNWNREEGSKDFWVFEEEEGEVGMWERRSKQVLTSYDVYGMFF